MDTDARLDRLTERHEALAQSLEILVAAVNSNATQIRELGTVAGILLQVVQSHQDRIGRLEGQ